MEFQYNIHRTLELKVTLIMMIKVKVSAKSFGEFIFRQTPQGKGCWGNCRFYVNENIEEADFWIVYGNLDKKEKTLCPTNNTIFISGEPPTIKTYPNDYLAQFATIMTCDPRTNHLNVIHTQTSLPWLYGLYFDKNHNISVNLNYDTLKTTPAPNKRKLLSVICSKKTTTPGHRSRLRLIEHLTQYFGNRIDIFGRGFQEIADKREAIDNYKYLIVMENTRLEYYWSEKLADCYLGYAYPLYVGCPNLPKYFSEDAFTFIDEENPEETVRLIEKIINQNQYEKSLSEIRDARDLILDN